MVSECDQINLAVFCSINASFSRPPFPHSIQSREFSNARVLPQIAAQKECQRELSHVHMDWWDRPKSQGQNHGGAGDTQEHQGYGGTLDKNFIFHSSLFFKTWEHGDSMAPALVRPSGRIPIWNCSQQPCILIPLAYWIKIVWSCVKCTTWLMQDRSQSVSHHLANQTYWMSEKSNYLICIAATNHRHSCMNTLAKCPNEDPWFGLEQEYTMLDPVTHRPLGWPAQGYPGPQGPYYCGVGASRTFGRPVADIHLSACILAGLKVTGTNYEVMPGQVSSSFVVFADCF